MTSLHRLESGLARDCWQLRTLGEPPLPPPHLELHHSSLVDVILVEQLLHLCIPFGKLQFLVDLSQLDTVEFLQVLAIAVESPQVDDAEAGPVEFPVIQPALEVRTTVLAAPTGLGQRQAHLRDLLHDETQTEDRIVIYTADTFTERLPEGARGGDMELLHVVTGKQLGNIFDPFVLREDAEIEPRSLGHLDDLLEIAVDILLSLTCPVTCKMKFPN